MSGSANATIIALLVLGFLILWWMSAVNSRELARLAARRFCQRQKWQLLDQTVALVAMLPRRDVEGWYWYRRYRFDFSPDGGQRMQAELVMHRSRVCRISADLAEGGQLIEDYPT